jgi:hypothetical protein
MSQDHGYFGEEVAATYDEATADMFDENVVGPAVGLLAELAGGGRARKHASCLGLAKADLTTRCFRNAMSTNADDPEREVDYPTAPAATAAGQLPYALMSGPVAAAPSQPNAVRHVPSSNSTLPS